MTVNVPQARLDQFLALHLPALGLARIRRAIQAGEVRVNGRRTIQGWVLKAGDRVSHPFQTSTTEPPPLDVLFEDDELLVINKPVGVQSHPVGGQTDTLMNALAAHLLKQGEQSAQPMRQLARPLLLHRLDRDTSGVLAAAKTQRAAQILSRAFQERRVTKRYLALVHGVVIEDGGEIDAPIGENRRERPHWRVTPDGSPARTRFTVKERFARHTLLELEPLTGRTHQLRVHCAHIAHPVVGDRIYKGTMRTARDGPRAARQLLHAHSLTFRHPTTGREMTITAPLPPDLESALVEVKNRD